MGSVTNAKTLHESDLAKWAEAMAAAVRSDTPLSEAERAQIAEELEETAGSSRRELKRRTSNLLMHLLKATYQPEKGTRSWLLTISEQRQRIDDLLEESPSLRPYLVREIARIYDNARTNAEIETGLDCFPALLPWTLNQILDRTN